MYSVSGRQLSSRRAVAATSELRQPRTAPTDGDTTLRPVTVSTVYAYVTGLVRVSLSVGGITDGITLSVGGNYN